MLLGLGDAFRKPPLPELYEPVLTNIGNGRLVLRDSSGKVNRGSGRRVLTSGIRLERASCDILLIRILRTIAPCSAEHASCSMWARDNQPRRPAS